MLEMWIGILVVCSALARESPPAVDSSYMEHRLDGENRRVWVVRNEADGASELRVGGDTCATATEIPWPLPPGGYTDTGSTFSAGDQYHTNDCNGDDGRARDVVYKITPDRDTALLISGCPGGSAGTAYDARGWVYEAGCPGEGGFPSDLEPIMCSDDGCGEFADPPHLVFPVTAGVTYYYVQDGWSGGRGDYRMDVLEIADGPVCDRFNVCADSVPYQEADALGDRFYLPVPSEPGVPDTCAEVEPCPDVPMGAHDCDPPGLLFCHGFFCDPLGCQAGTAGSPSRINSDFAGGRGGLDNRGFEGFWGLDDAIGGAIVWGEDYHIDPESGLITTDCVKSEFTVTYYADAGGAPGEILFGPFAVTATRQCPFSQCIVTKLSMAHPSICLKAG